MKHIAILLAASFAALAQQPAPKPKLYIEPGHPTTGALIKNCRAVTVTDDRAQADYHLDIAYYSGVLFNKNGEAVASFHAHWVSKFAGQICQYFEKGEKSPHQ